MAKNRKKYKCEQDSREDLIRLELLLISLENIPTSRKQLYTEEKEINKSNLLWLNHNLSLTNKHNVKLVETLKLIQRILKKI